MQATALVNEAFLKLKGSPQLEVVDRHHFYRLAAEAMRQILVDHARRRDADRRGGRRRRVPLDLILLIIQRHPHEPLNPFLVLYFPLLERRLISRLSSANGLLAR